MIVQRTELADLLIELRGNKTQPDFQRELELQAGLPEGALGSKYVSLVETGARKRLSPEFLKALEIKTLKPAAELEAMNRRLSSRTSDKRPGRSVRVVSGHTAFAAGLIGACLRGIPNVDLATCCEKPNKSAVRWKPTPENSNWLVCREGGIDPHEDDELIEKIANANETYYFSANDALDALDSGWADIVAVPSALVENRLASCKKLGRLVSSHSACALITQNSCMIGQLLESSADTGLVDDLWRKGEVATFEMSTRELANSLREMNHRISPDKKMTFKFGAEFRTIGEVVGSEISALVRQEPPLGSLLRNSSSNEFILPEIEIVPNRSDDAATFSASSLETQGELVWEPHATWILDALRRNNSSPHALIYLSRRADEITGRSRSFEFDLVTTVEKTKDLELVRSARRILSRTWEVSEELSSYNPSMHSFIVHSLARYFRLTEENDRLTRERCARVLGRIEYDVSLKMEAMPLFESVSPKQ